MEIAVFGQVDAGDVGLGAASQSQSGDAASPFLSYPSTMMYEHFHQKSSRMWTKAITTNGEARYYSSAAPL